MSEGVENPRSSVFTTMVFSKNRGVLLLKPHLNRMRDHATKLKIDGSSIVQQSVQNLLQNQPPEIDEGLVRIECSSTLQMKVNYRPFGIRNEYVDAVTVPSPVWPARVAGTKHGAWSAYRAAKLDANKAGADLALMIHEHSIVDGDRCTPVVMDEDGIIWFSDSPFSVESITLNALKSTLLAEGYHIQSGKLNERLVARCAELVAVGSGIGVVKIESIDGEPVGQEGMNLFNTCKSMIEQIEDDPNNWTGGWG